MSITILIWEFHPSSTTKKMHVKTPSAEVVCCMQMLMSMINFGIQTVWSQIRLLLYRSSLIWVHTVCYRDVLNGPADDAADDMRKPVFGGCEQHRRKPACSSRSLIRAFFIRFLENTIFNLATGKISII